MTVSAGSGRVEAGRTVYRGPHQAVVNRALVVDDDPGIGEIISVALKRVGYEVSSVESATEALLSFDQARPDVVITDWKMPGMDGIELVNTLKQQDPDLAAILMTGFGTKETIIDAFTRGKINYYLPKPFKLDELLELVSAAVKERKLALSEKNFRLRLEEEISRATGELEAKNTLLEAKQRELEYLNHELRMRQEEIEGTKEYLENLLESSVDAIVSVGRGRNINYFSRGAEAMFGYTSADVQGCPMSMLFPADQSRLEDLLALLDSERRIKHFEAEMVRRSGEKIITDVSASRLRRRKTDEGLLFIIKDIAEQKRLEEELRSSNIILEKLSVTDGLTGLYNHRYFQKILQEEFQRSRRFQTYLALILLDLDDFKQVNDTYGHQAGDQVLIQLSEIMRESIREVDTPVRYGGEEFAIVLPQTEVDSAIYVAERLKEAIERSPRFQEIEPGLTITASLGLCGYPDPGCHSAEDLIRYADKAMYRAKQIGKNRVVVGSSRGETPLGRGEHLTPSEKRVILRRVADNIRQSLDLGENLRYLLSEVIEALRGESPEASCSIMLLDSDRGLTTELETEDAVRRRPDFEYSARLALEKRKFHPIEAGQEHGPAVSYPILIELPNQGRELVGIINIGVVPPDLQFFSDLADQAAMGIVNAKLFGEVRQSRTALELKVNQLISLSLMGMALQRNALALEDYDPENRKLLARSLAQVGFTRVLVYKYDPVRQVLFDGVDSSLRGLGAPQRVGLEQAERQGPVFRAATEAANRYVPTIKIAATENLGPLEQRMLEKLGLGPLAVAAAQVIEQGRISGMVVGFKESLDKEDAEIMSMFVLHANLIMDNLNLSKMYQDKNRRLTLVHEMGLGISTARTPDARVQAVRQALEGLTEVLRVSEISVYTYDPTDQTLNLMSFSSATAQPGSEPAGRTRLQDSPIMALVVECALLEGKPGPLTLNNLKSKAQTKGKKRFTTDSYLGVPLFGGGEFFGIMNLADKVDRSGFSLEDADLAQTAAGILGGTLYHLALLSRIEDLSLNAVRSLVEHYQSRRGARTGRTGRVAGIAAGTAQAMGLDDRAVEQIRSLAWIREFLRLSRGAEPEDGASPDREACGLMWDWIKGIQTGWADLDTEGSDEVTPWPGRLPEAAVSLAEALEEKWLGLKPARRPDLDVVLFDLFRRWNEEDQDVFEALVRALIEGHIIHGRRRVRLGEDAALRLAEKLAGQRTPRGERLIDLLNI